ncbi:nuclear transport factor 2 family protein [Nocardiopsis kunsanensis]|nr:nuclear transport factor 2 family protein [Nocardiopsis kunsanensis]
MDVLISGDAVRECVIRERWARDTGHWDVMDESYYEDTRIAVGWASCSGSEFIEKTKELAVRSRGQGLHQLGPIRVELSGDRAFAELPAQIVMPIEIDGYAANLFVWERMCFRVEKREDDWRISEFRAVYLKDAVFPEYPQERISVDRDLLGTCRRSYQYTHYWSIQAGWGDHPDRPGVDRPELMDEVYRSNREWLYGAPGA